MTRSIDDDGAPAFKRARTQATGAAPLDPMAATKEQLQGSTDPHLQAKLLLDYSAQAVAPEANTEAAIDFLFAFLQQSQTPSSTEKEGDGTKSPPAGDGSRASGSNAVVVAAIVRGLRGLLAVNPSVVEPMIQLDAMGEQLTQCVSVPEDFKLRRDMLRIVLDCLVQARKFAHTEQLLKACMDDHDDGLRAICLDGYIRLRDAGHHAQSVAVEELVTRLCRMLAVSDDKHTRELAARVLGRLATSVASVTAQEAILHALASNAPDASPQVRREIAIAFRRFAGGPLPESLFLHLLQKTQINEDLSEIDSQSVALLTNGAMLTLMEDEDQEVTTESSSSIRLLCEGGAWGSDLVDRAVSSHIELAARAARYRETNLLTVLANLLALLQISKAKEGDRYPLTREELFYLLGSLPTNSLLVALSVIKTLPLLSVDHAHAAMRVVKFIIQCAAIKSPAEPNVKISAEEVRDAMQHLGDTWSHDGVSLSASTIADLRDAALAQGSASVVSEACGVLHDALCSPTERLATRTHQQPSVDHVPTFLSGLRANGKSREGDRSSRPLASAFVQRISNALQTLQRLVTNGSNSGLKQEPMFSSPVKKACDDLRESCRSLLARTQHCLDTKAKTALFQLLFISAWVAVKTPEDVKPLVHHAIEVIRDAPGFLETLKQLQNEENAERGDACFRRLVADSSMDELQRQLSSSKLDAIVSASITEPDLASAAAAHEVSSHLPFALHVRCMLRNIPKDAELYVKARVPSGDLTYTRLPFALHAGADHAEAEATVELHFKPFSDPSQVVLAVCLKAPRVFVEQRASTEEVDYVDVSPATKLQVQHRFNPALRHQNSRSG